MLFAVPLILSGILTQAHNTIDGMIAGRYLGEIGLAAIGGTSSYVTLVSSLLWGYGMGASIYTAMLFASKDYRKLKVYLYNNIFVFQDFCLISTLSVKENIKIAALAKDKKIDEKWYEDVIELLGLKNRVYYFPHQLSGGEKQRVAIARAIINKPKVIFADEPTGNLDNENTIRIMNYLEKYARGNQCILIYVTHEKELCSIADVIVNVADKCVKIRS